MKAYKFRAASQFAFALDIIFNRRLYCADWRTLNDPMEGRFVCTDRGPNERITPLASTGWPWRWSCQMTLTKSKHFDTVESSHQYP